MPEYKVIIPEETPTLIEFTQDGYPGVAIVNAAMKGFEPKPVFAWNLSMIICYKNHTDKRLPNQDEIKLLQNFEESLHESLSKDGNALFLASISHDGYRELIWRVYRPEIANDYLLDMIEAGNHPREFDFTIEHDPTWVQAQWPIQLLDEQSGAEQAWQAHLDE
ncbi:Uncharacterised protein [BD1-7 clade bacterium]|uniref:DUF695 domain-containing protein n=1 Tax=BD1-7 clade bacterium TaxID=2029982 RepID=A0A5S9PUS4_9GAMM|nr:Uncharacterised protein [BD1-7 clade bacterium]CAA0107986.1 Uncharacterised protein [BD1-7 clade bacterium]